MAFGLAESIYDFGGSAEEMLPSIRLSHNGSYVNCPDLFCNLFDEIGPPLDWLPPPPPLPPHLFQLLSENYSLVDDKTDGCNLCHIFSNSAELVPKTEFETQASFFPLLIGSIIGSTILCIILFFILLRFRKWKLFPPSGCGLDSCPISPASVMGGLKTSPPACATSDDCISPVVNEKSPQSVITNCPTQTYISSKYWRRSDGSRDGRFDTREDDMEEYSNIPDGRSYTSSPVYAELNSAGITINPTQILPSSLFMNGPSPYAVHHTYSEVADLTYGNVDYQLTSNTGNYQGQSLRRQRFGSGHLGNAAPFLSSHQQMNVGPAINFATGDRPHKKSRLSDHSHHASRINLRNQQMQQTIDPYITARRSEAIYADYQQNSPSLSTFRVTDNFRENTKRPFPTDTGVRL